MENNVNLMRLMARALAVTMGGLLMFGLFKNPSLFIGVTFPLWAAFLLVVVLLILEPRWSAKRIKKAKDELDLLTRKQPEYWEPLTAQIKQIVISYGNAEHCLIGSRQVTRLTDT